MKDTREYIIDESFKLFLTHSYEAVSISMISSAIGFTKGALYHHFRNKEDLFHAVIDKHLILPSISVETENLTLKEYTDLCIEHTHKVLTSIIEKAGNVSPINYISLIADTLRHYEVFGREQTDNIKRDVDTAEKVIGNAIQRGEIRGDINVHAVASQYFSITIGMAGDVMMHNSLTTAVESLIDSLTAQLNQLYGLLKI
ncbi:MAG TPA: TetR/AcrR family transcriptional regulator [Bacteroidales bacterium]|nr:TetR/AcrR family transcriptional regulator [Bacteroidales bacterium]